MTAAAILHPRFLANPERYNELGDERPRIDDVRKRATSPIVDQSGVAVSMLEVTRKLWSFKPWRGREAQPMDHAWRALFGEELAANPPQLFHYCVHKGRELVVRAHRGGRLSVLDQTTGRHEIRVLDARWEAIVNACTERANVGGLHRHAHLKMAAATERFLQQRAAL